MVSPYDLLVTKPSGKVVALTSVKPVCKIRPKLDLPISRGRVELDSRWNMLTHIRQIFDSSVLNKMGTEEDIHVLLFAFAYRVGKDTPGYLLWLLKRGAEYLFVEQINVVHRGEIQIYVLSRIVQSKPLSAIIEALKNDSIEDASEVGALEKEAIIFKLHKDEKDTDGKLYVVRV